MATESALSTLSRYEALFELSSELNVATDIEGAGQLLARRLKYVADVYSWRYFSLERESEEVTGDRQAMVVDGHRGRAAVEHVELNRLCSIELDLWKRERPSFLEDQELEAAQRALPEQFKKEDIVQIFVCPRFGEGELQSMFLFSKRRRPFKDSEVTFLGLVARIFHDKVYLLWQQKKLRDLETAYLQQEIMLRQSEKLATLGKLSAGMAHELNNPAAAAQRSADQLLATIEQLAEAQRELGAAELGPAESEALATLAGSIGGTAAPIASGAPAGDIDPLRRAELEDELEEWLEALGVKEAWQLAPTLASSGWGAGKLAELVAPFDEKQIPVVLTALRSRAAAADLVEEIRQATERVSQIVNALRSYSYLDQAPIQRIDVHDGLESTLVILQGKLGTGVTVQREFDPDLPQIEAYGTELNQVWTNIIDNAVAAMQGSGKLTLKTHWEDPWVVVEIKDSGPGISDEIRPKVFDPFFTTKPPGQGTGLGLSVAHNTVVQKHHGTIEVRSVPGETCFSVRLPLDPSAEARSAAQEATPGAASNGGGPTDAPGGDGRPPVAH